MAQRALVIGGAGKVGRGVVEAFRDAGIEVLTVDPAGGEVPEPATTALLERVGRVDLAVVSLPARGRGREQGDFRPARVAADELPGRLEALELACRALSDGLLVELTGGAALEADPSEAGLIGGWQRGIHAGFGQAGTDAVLCAITCFVDPDGAAAVGRRILEIAGAGRTGLCRIDDVDGSVEWVD